jgi:hypothetical protein
MLIRSRNRDRSRGGSVALSSLATGYLNGVTPYHYAGFITNRMLYAGADVGTVAGGTGYSFTRASDGYYTNADGTLTNFASGALRRGDRGVLIEGSRTNLLLQSGFAGGGAAPTSWVQPAATGTSAPATSTLNPSIVAYEQSGTAQRPYLQQTVTIATNTTYTLSVYVEAVTGTIPLANLLAVISLPAGATATEDTLGNLVAGQRRTIVIAGTYTGGAIAIRAGLGASSNATGTVRFSMPQFEAGSFPSSYIPTVAAAATRAADVLTYTVNTTAQINAAVAGQPELVTNGTFDTDITGWDAYGATLATVSHSSGALRSVNNGTTSGAGQTLTLEIGKTYRITATLVSKSASAAPQLRVGPFGYGNASLVSVTMASPQTQTALFRPAHTTIYVSLHDTGTTSTEEMVWDNVSIKEVPANSLTLYPLQLWSEFERAVDTGGTESILTTHATSTDSLRVYVSSADNYFADAFASSANQGGAGVATSLGVGVVYKGATRLNTNSNRSALSGTLSSEDTTVTLPANPTTLMVGAQIAATTPNWGYIRRIAVIQGAGTDAQLQSMTGS